MTPRATGSKDTPPENAARIIYTDYISNCRRKNVFWELTLRDVYELTSRQCHYCGRPPALHRRGYTYNGMDRLDPKQGYVKKNVVTSCFECNSIKSNKLTPEETKTVAQALKKFREELADGKGTVPAPPEAPAEGAKKGPRTKRNGPAKA
jgi:hypothetical protein